MLTVLRVLWATPANARAVPRFAALRRDQALWPQLQHLAKLHVKLLVREFKVREGRDFCEGSGWWMWHDGNAAVRPSPVHLPVRGCPWQEPRIIGEIQAVWAVGRVPEVRVLKSTSSGGLKRLDLSLLVPIKSTIDRAATAPHLESLWGGGKIAELRPYLLLGLSAKKSETFASLKVDWQFTLA